MTIAVLVAVASPHAAGAQTATPTTQQSPKWSPPPGTMGSAAKPLRVGTCDNPPFSSRDSAGNWEGMAIFLWRTVATDLNLHWTLIPCTLAEIESKLSSGEIDVAATGLDLDYSSEVRWNFAPPFDSPGLAAAVRVRQPHLLSSAFGHLMDPTILLWLTALILGSLFFGLVVRLVERRAADSHFSQHSGMRHALWWAWVTGSAVGYGDVVPRTHLGRFVASIWILISLVMIAMLTGAVSSALTIHALKPAIDSLKDIQRYRVGIHADSTDEIPLHNRGVTPLRFANDELALLAVESGEIDVFARSRRQLEHTIFQRPSNGIVVLPDLITHSFIALGLSNALPMDLEEHIAQQVLMVIDTPSWQDQLDIHAEKGS